MPEPDKYLDYTQAAEVLSIRKGTLYAWVCRKRVPHIRLGPRCIRFSRDELNRWIDAGRVEAPANTRVDK